MCVCVCLYMCAFMYICVSVCICLHLFVSLCVSIYVCLCVCVSMCAHVNTKVNVILIHTWPHRLSDFINISLALNDNGAQDCPDSPAYGLHFCCDLATTPRPLSLFHCDKEFLVNRDPNTTYTLAQ